jgi:FKBP12-rapamycin complex-associated protein
VALQQGRYGEAQGFVDATRELLGVQLPALVGESYQRAYDVFVSVQELAEIEDIIELKTSM